MRTTATLDELLTQPRRRRRRSPDPDHLVPRVILDSRRLQVLMARGDARTDRELRRLVSLGRRAVRRLVRGQLDRTAGLGPAARAAMRIREVASSRWAARVGAGLIAVTVLATVVWWASAWTSSGDRRTAAGPAVLQPRVESPGSILDVRARDRYRGPSVTRLGVQAAALELTYRPAESDPMLTVFRIAGLDDDGRPIDPEGADTREPTRGVDCNSRCTEIVLELDGSSERVHLPVPTGHLLDPDSLRVTGGSTVLEEGSGGLPVLRLEGGGKRRVEYRTGEGVDGRAHGPGRWPALPDEVEDFAARLEPLRAEEAVQAATAWVQRRLVYDTSADTVGRHREAARDGRGLVDRCLTVGAGDCDVLNAVLAAILHRAGVPVRMAVGFVGSDGRALPGLHAWVEYPGSDGVWRWADASRGAAGRIADPAVGADARPAAREPEPMTVKHPDQAAGPLTSRWSRPASAGLLLGLLVIGAYVVNRSRVAIGDVRLADEADVAGLLRGALARPESYRDIPALFRRRVVPLIAGRPLSLERARSLARRGRLAAGTASSALARGVGGRRRAVIDTSRPEGRAVAGVLGAVDLDRWERMIDRGGAHPLMRRLEAEAREMGLSWELWLSPDTGGVVHVLDGRVVGRRKESALVVVDPAGEMWRRVLRLEDRAPAAAVLLLADEVVDSMAGRAEKPRRLLARLAAAAVSERAERSS
ncbi:MAG: transglutaminase-like domain-containing protein [Candidatus Sulfomarinibacteraceae bacterium]